MIFDDFFKSIDVFSFVFELVEKRGSVIMHVKTCALEGISTTNISESLGLFFHQRSQSTFNQFSSKKDHFWDILFSLRKMYDL